MPFVPKGRTDGVWSGQTDKMTSTSHVRLSFLSSATGKDLCRFALTLADTLSSVLCILSDGKYMKALDALSGYICNRLRQSAVGKLPSFPRIFLASSSCFEVFLNHIKYINFHFVLQKPTPSEGMCNFMTFPSYSH